jgi:uncharacterized protein (UPF0332 family)
MNPRDFLEAADDWCTGPREADWRSAASRAYYAAFHVAQRLLADLKFTVPRADRAHQYLIFRLSNCGEPVVEQAGRDLETLRRLRNRADYDELPPVTQPQAVAAVRRAEDVIRHLDDARNDPPRPRIRDAMIVYERDVLNDVTWHP